MLIGKNAYVCTGNAWEDAHHNGSSEFSLRGEHMMIFVLF